MCLTGLLPKGVCRRREPGAKQPCRHWQRRGALSHRKFAAHFLIWNRLNACPGRKQKMCRTRTKLNHVLLRVATVASSKSASPRFSASSGVPQPPAAARWISERRILSKLLLSILGAWCVPTSDAVTLETVFQTTLEKNPAIQEAKSNLEQAAGQRLVLRSVIWPIVTMAVPAGVQGGHRAGESGIKGFALARGFFTQTLFNAAVPPTLRRGDVDVLIAQQQLNVAVVQ